MCFLWYDKKLINSLNKETIVWDHEQNRTKRNPGFPLQEKLQAYFHMWSWGLLHSENHHILNTDIPWLCLAWLRLLPKRDNGAVPVWLFVSCLAREGEQLWEVYLKPKELFWSATVYKEQKSHGYKYTIILLTSNMKNSFKPFQKYSFHRRLNSSHKYISWHKVISWHKRMQIPRIKSLAYKLLCCDFLTSTR